MRQRRDDNLRRLVAAGPEHVRRYLAALPQPTRDQVVRELVRVAPELSSAIQPTPAGAAAPGDSPPAFDDGALATASPGAHWGPFGEIISPPQDPSVGAFEQATRGAGGEVPYRAQMEARFGTSFGGVQAHLGRTGLRGAGANAAAKGDTVAFASATPTVGDVAHELAHVMQQRRAGRVAAAASRDVSNTSDAAEREADAIAAATTGFDGPRVVPRAAPTARLHLSRTSVAHTPATGDMVTATQYLASEGGALRSMVKNRLATVPMFPAGAGVSLAPGAQAELRRRLLARLTRFTPRSFVAHLRLWLEPTQLELIVDRGRVIDNTAQYFTASGTKLGPLHWYDDVATEVAGALLTRIHQSMRRMAPRYAHAWSKANETRPTDKTRAEPDAALLEVSHPLDEEVAHVLCSGGLLAIDRKVRGGAKANPTADTREQLRLTISYSWVEDARAWNFVKVSPADASVEEVAKTVLGSATYASQITVSPPFFGMPKHHRRSNIATRSLPAATRQSSTTRCSIGSRRPSMAQRRRLLVGQQPARDRGRTGASQAVRGPTRSRQADRRSRSNAACAKRLHQGRSANRARVAAGAGARGSRAPHGRRRQERG